MKIALSKTATEHPLVFCQHVLSLFWKNVMYLHFWSCSLLSARQYVGYNRGLVRPELTRGSEFCSHPFTFKESLTFKWQSGFKNLVRVTGEK